MVASIIYLILSICLRAIITILIQKTVVEQRAPAWDEARSGT